MAKKIQEFAAKLNELGGNTAAVKTNASEIIRVAEKLYNELEDNENEIEFHTIHAGKLIFATIVTEPTPKDDLASYIVTLIKRFASIVSDDVSRADSDENNYFFQRNVKFEVGKTYNSKEHGDAEIIKRDGNKITFILKMNGKKYTRDIHTNVSRYPYYEKSETISATMKFGNHFESVFIKATRQVIE